MVQGSGRFAFIRGQGGLLRTCNEGDTLTLDVAGETYPVILKEKTVSILNEAIEQISFQAVKA